MAKYFEVDRGRFESSLIRGSSEFGGAVQIAYTSGDHVMLTEYYRTCDRAEVEKYADTYDCDIIEYQDRK